MSSSPKIRELDCSQYRCPMPLLKTKQAINQSQSGDVIKVIASDRGSLRDIPAWLKHTDHHLESVEDLGDRQEFLIKVS